MLSRALSLATVTLLIGCLTAAPVRAQENLEAGKSPAQMFANTCNACHKSPRGLLRTVPASSLPGFLRQHYTTGGNMASVLSSYLVANGAADTRPQKDAKGKDGTKEARAPADAKQQSRLPQPGETTDPQRPDLVRPAGPAQAAVDPRQKQKHDKKGHAPETARTEPAEAPKDAAKGDEGAKPDTPKTESAKVEPSKDGEATSMRPDPVPAVTPAPATAALAPSTPAPGASTVPIAPLDSPAPAPAPVLPEFKIEPKAPAVAEAPALPPVPPAGPPTVPISQ